MQALWLVGLGLISGCADDSKQRSALGDRAPLILFAVDGLEWSVLKPLLDQGRLPVLKGLMDRGTYGSLGSMIPTQSPVIWTTAATGKLPGSHGILGFAYERVDGQPLYFTSGHRRVKAFWNQLSDFGLTVHCFGWWMTFPVEPINGVMVSQTNTTEVLHDLQRASWKGSLVNGVKGQVHPPERQERVMRFLEEVEGRREALDREIFGERAQPVAELSQLLLDKTVWSVRADEVYARAALDLLGDGEPFDVLAIYIGGSDVVGHRFWRYRRPEEFEHPPSSQEIENLGAMIDDYYIHIDRTVGELLEAAPADTAALIVSDHGMHAVNRSALYKAENPPASWNSGNHQDAPPGVLIAAGPPFRKSGGEIPSPGDLAPAKLVGTVVDLTPTLLAIKGVPLGKDFDGQPLTDLIDPAWLEARPFRFVASHDDQQWLAARENRIQEAVDQSERLEQLRELGYIK